MANVRFIIGRSGSGKTARIVESIVAQLSADSLGPPIFLLVPDQATLLYERLLVQAAPRRGYARLQVITFRQLNEWLLARAGGSAIPEVTALGRRILIGRLLRRLEGELTYYGSTARQPGLAGRLDEAFAEIESSGRTDADLLTLADEIAASHTESALPAKLRDLALILREYERLLGSERLDQHRRHRLALDAVDRCPGTRELTLYVDGFYEFNRAERQLLHRLGDAGCQTTIALTVDPADAGGTDELPLTHLLRQSTYTFRRLARSLAERGQAYDVERLSQRPRFERQSLLHIERHFGTPRPGPIGDDGAVRFIECVDRAAEADAAARQILDWVATGVRFRDIVVLARDANEYAEEVERSFTEHRIAFFVDRQETAAYQPLIRTVRAVVQLGVSDWSADRVLDLMKAGLVGVDADVLDALENYLIAHRIRGLNTWRDEWRFRGSAKRRAERAEGDDAAVNAEREDLVAMNAARRRIVAAMGPMLDSEAAPAAPTSHWCQRLCEVLDALGVREQLGNRITASERAGNVEGALRQREVWSEFSELLDQLCTVLSGEALSLREFSEVIEVALERFVLSIIPPTIDQVLVGSADRTRSGPVRCCVILGLSEGQFPRRASDVDAFSDEDRRQLESRDVELRAGSRTALLDEQFLAYLAVTRPSQSLTAIRASSVGATPIAPSTVWTQLRALVPSAPVERVEAIADAAQIGSARQLVETVIRWSERPDSADDAGRHLLTNWMTRTTDQRVSAALDSAQGGLRYHNLAALPPDVAAELYPSPIRGSATRFETFAQCPFKHFAQHALRLATRDEPELTRAEIGTLYHRVLEQLVRSAIDARHDLAAELPDLTDRIRALAWSAAGELRDELLLSDGRTQHLIEGVERTLEEVAQTQQHALHRGQFRPRETELAFGLRDDAPPLVLDTPAGRRVELRGKVDRVDTFAAADRVAAAVIDYKLSGQSANYDRIFHGLSLQLVTYLLVLNALGERWTGVRVEPAAALYVKLARPLTRVEHPSDAPEPGTLEFWLTTANKARGIINEQFADTLDGRLVAGERSPAYAIHLPKTAAPIELKRLDVLNHEAFAALIEWSREKVGQLADRIAAGEIAVRPYRLRTLTPCSHCDFRPVCRLDLAFNDYHWIDPRGEQRLRQIVEEAAS